MKLGLPTAAVLACLGAAVSAEPAPAQPLMPREKPTTASDRPDASAARRATLDPVRLIADQMRLEKNGNMTGRLSQGFKAAYDAVPRDEDNLGPTILGFGYDVPDRVVTVSGLRYEDVANPVKASATATLHYTNEDAPVPSFNRSIVVAFAEEEGQWKIDDVRPVDPKGRRTGWEFGLRRGSRGWRKNACAPPSSDLARQPLLDRRPDEYRLPDAGHEGGRAAGCLAPPRTNAA